MITEVNGVKHYITLQNVMYTPKDMYKRISISQALKKWLKVRIDDDPDNATLGRMELHHKPSCDVKMCGTETDEGVYEAVARLCT